MNFLHLAAQSLEVDVLCTEKDSHMNDLAIFM